MKRRTSRLSSLNSKQSSNQKLQSINRILLSKIDNILEDNNIQEKPSYKPIEQSNKDEMSLPIIIPNINRMNQLPQIKPKQISTKSKKKSNRKPNKTFEMTDVGLVKTKPIKPKKQKKIEDDPVISSLNKQIDEMINNINEIEDTNETTSKNQMDLLAKEGRDFRQLINDIDEYKEKVHEEFDEVKYLIKFADNTHKLINRHKNVMTNIFKGAGIAPRVGEDDEWKSSPKAKPKKYKVTEEEEEDDDDEPKYRNGYYYRRAKEDNMNDLNEIFDKLKKINKIKDNLSNIQDDFLGYHHNLKQKIKEKHHN